MTTTSQNATLARQVKFTDYFNFLVWQMEWMHYDATNDLAFCHLCMMGAKSCKLSSFSESAFIFSGFSKRKDATRCFNKHEGSLKH